MPLIPEAVMAMLAVVRLGAVHSVVFGGRFHFESSTYCIFWYILFVEGFAASELCTRIEHAEPKVVIAANCGVEPNKIIPYLEILHDALALSRWQPDCSIIFQRSAVMTSTIDTKTDVLWETILNLGVAVSCVPVEANDPL